MDKRYQVFVSSTFRDLQEERQEVMQALLELDCIPSGMELFPAANDDQWTLIKKVIDDCDYYIVIIAGRYGSLAPDGISYTEKEYRYALERGKPIIGFLHKSPGDILAGRSEIDPQARDKLDRFRELIQQKVCRYWDSPSDLGGGVSRSLIRLIKTTPAIGWVRADNLPAEDAVTEIVRLGKQVQDLERALQEAAVRGPQGSEQFAQGNDTFMVQLTLEVYNEGPGPNQRLHDKVVLTWNEIASAVLPLVHETTEYRIKDSFDAWVESRNLERLIDHHKLQGKRVVKLSTSAEDFQTIMVQLQALGLIARSLTAKSPRDPEGYWTLTPFGNTLMIQLKAIWRAPGTSAGSSRA